MATRKTHKDCPFTREEIDEFHADLWNVNLSHHCCNAAPILWNIGYGRHQRRVMGIEHENIEASADLKETAGRLEDL